MADNVSQVRDLLKKIQKNLECPICLELLSDPYTTQCSHPFCRVCIYTVISTNREAHCPMCKERITKRSMHGNPRLGEIIEAVKDLEQAIVEDTGIPTTPPRPLPPHSHDAMGTSGIIAHSSLHPTPEKPHPRTKRTKNLHHASEDSSSRAYSAVGSGSHGTNSVVGQASISVKEGASSSNDTISGTTGKRGSKLSIKRRTKKKVKFSTEKPVIQQIAKEAPSSPVKVDTAVFASPLQALELGKCTGEGEGGTGNGNGIKEVAVLLVEPVDYGKLGRTEGGASPARKKAKIEGMSPSRSTMSVATSSQPLPTGSQRISRNISRILETASLVDEPMECAHSSSSNQETLLNIHISQLKLDPENPSGHETGEKVHTKESPAFAPGQTSSTQSVHTSTKPGGPVHTSSHVSETPFNQASEMCSSAVTKIMETPFVRNVLISPVANACDGDEQSESVLTKETKADIDDELASCQDLPDKFPMDDEEEDSSSSILVEDSQDTECHVKAHQPASGRHSHLELDMDGSCSVLSPTPVTNIPESQLNSLVQPLSSSQCLPLPVSILQCDFTKHYHGLMSQHTANKSTQGSQVSPSGGTVCIGETQFTKCGSQDKKSSSNSSMPSPPASQGETLSPTIPLQNSDSPFHKDIAITKNRNLSGSRSKVFEAQFPPSLVPSSQPSPASSKRHPKSPLLPGLEVHYRQQPLSLATTDNETSHLFEESEEKLNECSAVVSHADQNKNRHKIDASSEQSEIKLEVESPMDHSESECIAKSPKISDNRNVIESEHVPGPAMLVESTQNNNGIRGNARAVNSAFSNLHSQRDSLQSQISCSIDLTSQQLELLRLEMEAKQREIDELEAALKQVKEEERLQDTSTCTQSSAKSISVIAETLPDKSISSLSSEHQWSSPEQHVRSVPKVVDEYPLSTEGSAVKSLTDSRIQRDEGNSVVDPAVVEVIPNSYNNTACLSSIEQMKTPDQVKLIDEDTHNGKDIDVIALDLGHIKRAVPTSYSTTSPIEVRPPRHSVKATPKKFPHKLEGQQATKMDCSSQSPSQTNTAGLKGDLCSSQSIEAVLQAADDVLRKLRNPPLAVLEERSCMEIDKDLCSSSTPSGTGIKAKLQISSATMNSPDVKQLQLMPRDKSIQHTLDIDSRLCATASSTANKEESSSSIKRITASTSTVKKVYGSSTKSKKKKAPLVLLEPCPPRTIYPHPPIAMPSPHTKLGQKLSPGQLFTSTAVKTPDRGHSSRENIMTGCASGTPQLGTNVLQRPAIQTSIAGTCSVKEVSTVSPCRQLILIGKDHPPSYLASGLSKLQLRNIQTLTRRYGGRLASCFNGSTSHIIVSADESGRCSRTVKYLQGVATGRWIVSHQWVIDSLEGSRLLSEADYEVVGDHVTAINTHAPMRSRQLHESESPALFADYAFLFVGTFNNISQDHLAQLIQLSGGRLMSSIDDIRVNSNWSPSHTCVVCDDGKIKLPRRSGLVQVNSGWILDCLSNYCILPAPTPS